MTQEFLHLDDHLAAISKPSGLLVHRGWDNDNDVAMFRVRDALGQLVYPLHRLDRGTSGVVLFARSRESAAAFAAMFETGGIKKSYLALVRGTSPEEGTIDYPLQKTESGPRVPAVTHYRTIARSHIDRCSLVEAHPETGRLHQVRRHLRHINHPIVGDVKHGSGVINRHYRSIYNLHRLALHARACSFTHPFTRQNLVIEARLPADLEHPFHALGLLPT